MVSDDLSDVKEAELTGGAITTPIFLLEAAAPEDLGHRLFRENKWNVACKSQVNKPFL